VFVDASFGPNAHEWFSQSVWIFVNILQCDRFGADMSSTQWIVFVTPYIDDLIGFSFYY